MSVLCMPTSLQNPSWHPGHGHIIRELVDHGGPGADGYAGADANLLPGTGPDSDPARFTHGDEARQSGSRADMHPVTDHAVMIHRCPCIYDACDAQCAVGLDDRASEDHATRAECGVFTHHGCGVDDR